MTLPTDQLPIPLDGTRDLDHYNPHRGLQKIAVAESAESYYRRARDAEQLFAAIELKLTEQRKFLRWYDAQPKDHGAATQRGNRTVTTLDIPALFGIQPDDINAIKASLMMLSRWRKALLSDEGFHEALEDARHRAVRICEQEQTGTVRGTEGTGEFELYTPAHYIEAAREVLGEIDLDPASNELAQSTVQARDYFTPETDGLTRDWNGRVWLNPPYHRDLLPAFVNKLVGEVAVGRTSAAIMLTNNCTDTIWFNSAQATCQAICFTAGRIRFLRRGDKEVAPTQGQAFFYFGPDVDRFAEVFADIGFGVVPRWGHAP